ncbi:MAG: hypothetical protein V7603_1200 [Micromonosporaceae bacterium]
MRRLPRRLLLALTTFVLAAAAAAVAAQPAHADPVIDLNFANVTGTTYLAKPRVTAVIPQSTITTKLDLGTGQLTGQAKIPDLTVHLALLNFVKVTSTVSIVPAGDLTGTVDLAAGKLSTTTRFTIAVRNVHLDATPGINLVPSGCRTRRATSAVLTNTTPIDLFGGTTVSGTYTTPSFTHCGLTTPLLTQLLAGPANVLTLTLK